MSGHEMMICGAILLIAAAVLFIAVQFALRRWLNELTSDYSFKPGKEK